MTVTIQRHAVRILFLFALLAGQWLYVTHTHDHDASESEHVCHFCLYAILFDSFLPAPELQLLIPTSRYVISSSTVTLAVAQNVRFHDARAPPRG